MDANAMITEVNEYFKSWGIVPTRAQMIAKLTEWIENLQSMMGFDLCDIDAEYPIIDEVGKDEATKQEASEIELMKKAIQILSK